MMRLFVLFFELRIEKECKSTHKIEGDTATFKIGKDVEVFKKTE